MAVVMDIENTSMEMELDASGDINDVAKAVVGETDGSNEKRKAKKKHKHKHRHSDSNYDEEYRKHHHKKRKIRSDIELDELEKQKEVLEKKLQKEDEKKRKDDSDEHTGKVSEFDSDSSSSFSRKGNKLDESKQISSKSAALSTRNGNEKADGNVAINEKSIKKISTKNGAEKIDDKAVAGEKLTMKISPSPERGRKRAHSREYLKHSEQYELVKRRRKEIEEILKNDEQNKEDKIETDRTLEEKMNSKNEKREMQEINKDNKRDLEETKKKVNENTESAKKTEISEEQHFCLSVNMIARDEKKANQVRRNELMRIDLSKLNGVDTMKKQKNDDRNHGIVELAVVFRDLK
ncbi:BMA-PRPF-4, isoform a [Dirofilaria immitis]|nr:BMA-PRPF-4, isoform a [Dirofilaria immitis]